MKLLPSFLKPKHFEPGNENEHIIEVIKRHNFVYYRRIFPLVFSKLAIILLISVGYFYARPSLSNMLGNLNFQNSIKFFDIAIIVILSIIFIWFLLHFWTLWLNHEFDNIVITDQRLVFVDQKWLFKKDVHSVSYQKITDIRYKFDSFISHYFKFGTIVIETSGSEEKDLQFPYIPNPEAVQGKIMQAMNKST